MSPRRTAPERDACEAIQDLLPRRVAGKLDAAEAALVDRHLERCPTCRAEAEDSTRLAGMLGPHLEGPEPPVGFPSQVRKRLRRR